MTLAKLAPSPKGHAPATPRILLADDSAVVRGLLARWLEAEGFAIAGVARNGQDAADQARRLKPDIVVLDVEMPEVDGLTAIPQILAAAPGAKILMSSTLTRRNAEVTLKALAAGASDYIAKPTSGLGGAEAYRADLIARVRALSGGARTVPAPDKPSPPKLAPTRPASARARIEAIVIGSSTGGPHALQTVLPALVGVTAPILVAQHMPAMFTAVLAEHLARRLDGRAAEAVDGEELRPGRIYVAPGDHHLRIERRGGLAHAALDRSPPVNFCRPAVDPLFASAAEAFGPGVLAAVLTGMGHDGRAGAQAIVAKGGTVIVQDEATSVVWGMPGAVAQAGLAAGIEPLDRLGPALLALTKGGQPS